MATATGGAECGGGGQRAPTPRGVECRTGGTLMGLDIKRETEREVIVPAPQVPEPVPQQEPAPT